MSLIYKTTSSLSFNEALTKLTQTIEAHHFKVLHTHDVQSTLAGKDIEHDAYSIVEFCRAPAAKQVLDANPLIGLFLPCRAVIYKTDTVHMAFMRPEVIKTFFPDTGLENLIQTVDQDIHSIIQTLNT